MFRTAARRQSPVDGSVDATGTPGDGAADPHPRRGRHHRSVIARARSDARDQRQRVHRARRRSGQVDAASNGREGAAAGERDAVGVPAAGSVGGRATGSGTVGPRRPGTRAVWIDNAVARRDPLTAPFAAARGLPGARPAPAVSAPVPAQVPAAGVGRR